MPGVAKILEAMRNNSKNIKYNDLLKVCIDYFGEPRTTGGSHAVFKKAKRSPTKYSKS